MKATAHRLTQAQYEQYACNPALYAQQRAERITCIDPVVLLVRQALKLSPAQRKLLLKALAV